MTNLCTICGEPMSPIESLFKIHGYICPRPKPPLKKVQPDPAKPVAYRTWSSKWQEWEYSEGPVSSESEPLYLKEK